ncbi:dihydrolipoamide acetyltransferase family protein [Flavihumibacter profundi]|uniref:dihydrolipoamide acetyltransferase family protein n=1 Tax=Flavihumibacter profundi TaxID=2716883 RepID=UPI001CC6EE45|nr:dihydrolipoamide acetyltransferase family protein [Flavihumibacter profundi]MBZ5855722.1 2-oxo acid dehydrogenase subunit E2 [Flavihumibacter profundi]
MAVVDLVMPKMGESIMEATILKWLKNPGDTVQQDETVLEIATDKVDTEVPSTAGGIIEEILYKVNDVVPVGAVIARIRTSMTEENIHPRPATQEPAFAAAPQYFQEATDLGYPGDNGGITSNLVAGNGNRFYSPLVLNIAANEGVTISELESIQGTGIEGRVTKKDILQFVEDKRAGNLPLARPVQQPIQHPAQQPVQQPVQPQAYQIPVEPQTENIAAPVQPAEIPPAVKPVSKYGENVEIIEMDRLRRLIADHMVKSKQTSPHVTSFTEADVTNLVLWREKMKQQFLKQEGTKITFTPLFVEAIVRCIKKYPLINSSLDIDKIIIKKDINIGMATALPSGNLIVPVIKNADQLNLVGLAKQVNAMADNARNGKLKPEDTQGGTFTLTNVGTFGSLMGTPIINQPQVAILAVGAIKKRPVVIETAQGDSIAIRHMMYLSMSYDHRIIDGSLGATFLTAVARELEHFDPQREF